jgi:NAD(P)-dependent dehydrogenase (short-subunit alcohol dehydrogenase family)
MMRVNGYGRIINISSGSILSPISKYVAYRASKTGVVGMTRALSTELGEDGITVNSVLPGVTASQMVEDTLDEAFLERSFSRQGIKRMGRPRDIGNAVAFLASPDPEFHRPELPGRRRRIRATEVFASR